MKLIKRILFFIVLLLMVFIIYVMITTGFFKSIENSFDGEIVQKIALAGAEDITVSVHDSFALISSTARHSLPTTQEEFGGLYYLDLNTEPYEPIHLTANFNKPFAPHGISMFKTDSSYTVMAVNHTVNGHSIEVFKLNGEHLVYQKTLTHPSIVSPNDIVLLDENRFYFTNDHKYTKGFLRFLEDYAGLSISNIVYFDGKNYMEVADGIAYANGINYDPQRKLLFVASPRKFLVKVYAHNEDGTLSFVENIDCDTGVDNIEFDTKGTLWIGAHPNLLRFASYAKGKKETAPSEIITITYRAKGDYSIEQVYIEDGNTMSASTVAAPFGDLILTGNVMDDEFLILKRTSNKQTTE